MKKTIAILMTVLGVSQSSLANPVAMIGFFCESNSKPSYAFPIDSNGNVQEVLGGHFSSQVKVNEFHLRNGDIHVEVSPFHPYCSVAIKYTNHTNNVFNKNSGILFSKSATVAIACEGGQVTYKQCGISVK